MSKLHSEKNDTLDFNIQNKNDDASENEGPRTSGSDSDCDSMSVLEESPRAQRQKVADSSLRPAPPRSDLAPFRDSEMKLAMLLSSIETMDKFARRDFMMAPLPPGVWLQCQIIRISTGKTKFNRKFSFCTSSGQFLAVCDKGPRSRTAHYSVSTDPCEVTKNHPCYVGKIRANFLGTEFTGYSRGANPSKLGKTHRGDVPLSDMLREEMVSISYDTRLLSFNPGRQQMHVILPHVEVDARGEGCTRTACKACAPKVDGLRALAELFSQSTCERGKQPLVRTYVNKAPKWSKKANSYVLDFHGRVTHSSVKNFQLVQTDNANEIYLQFGRYCVNKFNLDFGFPLSPFQALCIAMSALDYKASRA